MHATDTPKTSKHHSIKLTPKIENIRFIYLNHSPIDEQLYSKLIQINSTALFYTDARLVTDFIKARINEQFFLIISNDFSSDSFDSVCSLQSILAIFIYDSQSISDELRRKYPKIIDRYSTEDDLLKSLEYFIEKQTFVYTLFNPTKESASFLWYQMLIPVLKQLPVNSKFHQEIANKYFEYFQTNDYIFFRENYTSEQAIQWFTKDSFLLKLLNRALHAKNIEILYSFTGFIIDLYLNIETECEQLKNQGKFIVYHGEWMSKEEIERLKIYLGSFISINEFFITSCDRNTSLADSKRHLPIDEHVIFEIHVDPSMETIRFVDIPSLNEVLFSINSVFRIESIEHDLAGHLWNVKLFPSDDYLKFIEKQMNCDSQMIYFGHLLWNELEQVEQADYFFQILLKSFSNDHQDLSSIYLELGGIKDQIREYNLALDYYQHALVIRRKQIPEDHTQIALVLNNIGVVQKHMGDTDQAIEFYQQSLNSKSTVRSHRADTLANLGSAYRDKHKLDEALNCYQQALSIEEITEPKKVNTLRNIGLVYRDKQDLTTALKYFNQVLEICQTNIDLANCYGDIGHVYEQMNDLDLALTNYQQQYQIEEQYLPIDHPNLFVHFDLMVNTLKKKDQLDRAIELCQEKLSQFENHPRLAHLLILLATMYEDKNPKIADQYYQRALNILERNKTDDIFAKSLSTMTNFYWKCRMFDRALICQMKLLHFRRSTLLSNHNDIAYTLRGLARLYRAMNKSHEALKYFEQSLVILKANYGPEHPDVQNIQKEIFDLKDILKSISSSPKEDYNNRRISSVQKHSSILSHEESKGSLSPLNNNKSSTCCIL